MKLSLVLPVSAGAEMRLNGALLCVECPQQPFAAPLTKYLFGSSSAMNERRRDRSVIYHVLTSRPAKSGKLLKSQTFDKECFPKLLAMRRSCGANFDDESSIDSEGLGDAEGNGRGDLNGNEFCTIPSSKIRLQKSNSFLQSSVDILDPTALGIRPEPPNWPERESIVWTRLEQKAKSFDLPVSLRMIQKKIQLRKGFKVLEESASCSVKKAFSSMLFIMIELQSSSLKMREALCNEDLEMIINKVQSDMQSSFAWLFQQVFSRTPALMIYVMILLANFSLHSTSLNMAVAQASLVCETTMEMASIQHSSTDNSSITISDDSACGKEDELVANGTSSNLLKSKPYLDISPKEFLQVGDPELKSAAEVFLWNSMLDEATKMQADQGDVVLDHEVLQRFVSPISVELEADDYLEYTKTDIRYQLGLSQEPNNPLLLCNYAQFLLLVVHDPDRAEECFKKAVQVEPPDAESHSRYADFLWRVRKDLWGAEERYLEALAAEPENTHHISKYAEFLWRTGGEETCLPLNTSNKDNKNDLK